LKDIHGNDKIIQQLQILIRERSIPNLLLCGAPGIGKTTTVLAIAREILGEENMKDNVLELNASDERGIDVVRDKIITFAKSKTTHNLKFIILDEADSMTNTAQEALRIVMTDYNDKVRFALACNDSSKIIGPIQSRCAILRFMKLNPPQILKIIHTIIEYEKIQYDEEGIKAIIWSADGDVRSAINSLQSV